MAAGVSEGRKAIVELYEKIILSGVMGAAGDGLVEMRCFRAIQKIKAVIEDDSLEDPECFLKIEEIICVLEELGAGSGGRHDF